MSLSSGHTRKCNPIHLTSRCSHGVGCRKVLLLEDHHPSTVRQIDGKPRVVKLRSGSRRTSQHHTCCQGDSTRAAVLCEGNLPPTDTVQHAAAIEVCADKRHLCGSLSLLNQRIGFQVILYLCCYQIQFWLK